MRTVQVWFMVIVITIVAYTGWLVFQSFGYSPGISRESGDVEQGAEDDRTRAAELLEQVEQSMAEIKNSSCTVEYAQIPPYAGDGEAIIYEVQVLTGDLGMFKISNNNIELGANKNFLWMFTRGDGNLVRVPRQEIDSDTPGSMLIDLGIVTGIPRYKTLISEGEVNLYDGSDPVILSIKKDSVYYTLKIDVSTMLPVYEEVCANNSILRTTIKSRETGVVPGESGFYPPPESNFIDTPYLIYCYLSDMEYARGDYDRALEFIDKALGELPVDAPEESGVQGYELKPGYLMRKGKILSARGEAETAMQCYREAEQSAQNPDVKAEAIYLQGVDLYEQQQTAAAVDKFKQALSTSEYFVQACKAYIHLGIAYHDSGNTAEAEKAFERAMDLARTGEEREIAEQWLNMLRR